MDAPPPLASNEPLKFSNPTKLEKQMRRRGWTQAMIREALQSVPELWQGKLGPAWRYTHTNGPKTAGGCP